MHDTQDAEHAVALFTRAFEEHKIASGTLTAPSDNEPAVRACSTYARLRCVEVDISHIRPGVSNDNAQAENVLRTLKRNQLLPVRPFGNKRATGAWAETIARWYNTKHRHSTVHHVTPSECHRGEDAEILRRRFGIIDKAREENPERWFDGRVFAPESVHEVWVNPRLGTESRA